MSTSELQQDWKDADILPIFKSGDKLECGNYRPISLTSIVVKLLEKLIFIKLTEHIEGNHLLDSSQFGFRRHKSCEMQMLLYTSYLVRHFDSKIPVHTIYLDLQKAFDKVPHAELLQKVKFSFGIDGHILKWLNSFLTGRRQRVRIGNSYSSWANVTSGVPQGSVLAPLLFILYVSDMQEGLQDVKVLKFADDTKIYNAVRDDSDVAKLQTNLDRLGNWFTTWKMPVNVKKSGLVAFGTKISYPLTLYGEPLKILQSEKDLGIIMDGSLSFKCHIQTTIEKAMRVYGWLVRNLICRDQETIIRLYKALIRPILEYASSVWSPYRIGLINLIERVQRKVTKLIDNFRRSTMSYSERLRFLKLPTLKWRRNYLDLLKVFQIVHGDDQFRIQIFTLSSEVSPTILRRHALNLYKECPHTRVFQNHFVHRVIDHWNSLPNDLLDITKFRFFKKQLKMHLLSKVDPYKWDH
jgi:hypothetical protein